MNLAQTFLTKSWCKSLCFSGLASSLLLAGCQTTASDSVTPAPVSHAATTELDEETLPTEYEDTSSAWRRDVQLASTEVDKQTDQFLDGAFVIYNHLIEGVKTPSELQALDTAIGHTLTTYGELVLALESLQLQLNHKTRAASDAKATQMQLVRELSVKLKQIQTVATGENPDTRTTAYQKAMASTLLEGLKQVSFKAMNVSRSVADVISTGQNPGSERALSFSSH